MAWLAVSLILSSLLSWMVVSGIKVHITEIINLKDNDGVLRPQTQGPTKVNVSLIMHSLIVDDKRQVLELSGELHQEWDDPELEFSGSAQALLGSSFGLSGISGRDILNKVWRPDLSCGHEIKPEVTNSNADFLRIFSTGHLSWTKRVHYSFPCNLDLSGYPRGTHSCTLKIKSLGYNTHELEPSWFGDSSVVYEPMTISHGYELKDLKTSGKVIANSLHIMKRELQVEMEIRKTSGWTLKHTMIPMTLTVITAYLSFFINIRGVAARITTCMLSMVTAAVFHESSYRMVPPASYTMALEVFTGTCLAFVFIATVESVIVDVLAHFPTKGKRSTPSPHTSFALEPDLTDERGGARGQVAALWLDRCFRVLYPSAFLAFNAVYWILYN